MSTSSTKLNNLLEEQNRILADIVVDIDKTLGMVNTALVEYHASMSEEQLWAEDKKVQTAREKAYISHFGRIKQNVNRLIEANKKFIEANQSSIGPGI